MAVAVAAAPATGAVLPPDQLARYADAIVLGSLHLREGDTLFVQGHPAHRELTVALANSAYRAGASLVDVQYAEPRAQAARVRYARDEHLGPLPPWASKQLRAHLQPSSNVVTLLGEADPGVFDGLPPERVAEDSMRALRRVGWYLGAVRAGRRSWVGAGWPTAYWASQVYPDLDPLAGQQRLARDLLWFCRLGPDDPSGFEGWTRHVEAIERRALALSELPLERLELRGPGTCLDLGLSPRTRWLGGQEVNQLGRQITPNIPTEECFTSPDAAATEGTFRCSRPLSFRGRTIVGIAGEFRRGRLIRLEAATDDDREFLAAFLHADRNADRLGEVALVDSTSRIGQAERAYSNTLIDENAVAHIAFGLGFGQTREDPRRSARQGVNQARLHLDVMIGTDELEATGITAGGDRVPLIAGGLWTV